MDIIDRLLEIQNLISDLIEEIREEEQTNLENNE